MQAAQLRLSKSFQWLNATQFLGALNDNVFRLLIIIFLTDHLGADNDKTVALVSLVFVLPFLLFSHAGGIVADRFSKRHITVGAKAAELAVMLGAVAAIAVARAPLLYALLFLMCTQSAFFGPTKYGIIPELVERHSLSRANSLLVSLSYLAIIIGTFLPSLFLERIVPQGYAGLAVLCVAIAVAGLLASMRIGPTPAGGKRQHFTPYFVADIYRTLRDLRSDKYLLMTVLGSAYFLFLGAFIQQNILLYGGQAMGVSMQRAALLFPMAALGIGIGALLAGRVSGRNIEFGIVPIGAAGLTLCCILLNLVPPRFGTVLPVMFFLGLSSGLFIVPIESFIQYRSPARRRGEIIACANFLSFLGVALSAGLLLLFSRVLRLTPGQGFVIIGLLTGGLAVVTVKVLPDFLIRFVTVLITRLFYRIRILGAGNIPDEGGALLVSNHVTWVDALLILATQQRRIRFIMLRETYAHMWWLRPVFRLMGVIPISPTDRPREILKSFAAAREALDAGYEVCIFAEGALTRNGNMQAFRPGLERIVKGSRIPVVPVYIGGAWGSWFSHYRGAVMASLPRRIPYPVSVSYGPALPADTPSFAVRQAVCVLASEAASRHKTDGDVLSRRFVRQARRHWWRRAMTDSTGRRLSFGQTLIAATVLSRALRKAVPGQRYVGVLMPTVAAGALVNIALTLLGKIPVNLNYTASASAVAAAIAKCDIRTVIASRAFLEKLESFQAPPETVYIEDIAAGITRADKVRGSLAAWLLPSCLLREKAMRRVRPDDPATVIFSSGSTAEPKGVMLSHHNLIANVASVQMVFRFEPRDRLCGILPFFHAFGFTVTLWGPFLHGFSVSYHPNPLDGEGVGRLCREECLTSLVATPTFLLGFLRRAQPEDFRTLRAVVTGAEKLRARVADAFEERFGIRPYEGYGATELSPVAALNLPDITVDGVSQTGSKVDSVGHPVPHVAMRVVDLETGQELPPGSQGLLEVRGPNVMIGYLNDPGRTAEVLRDGWYNSGDIACMDEDGFVFLKDRLARFSKIGGEMVPHIAIEEALGEQLAATENVIAVTAVPDERKGEQIVICFTPAAGTAAELHRLMAACTIPNLWKPRLDHYIPVDTIPVLGTGKRDLAALKALAADTMRARRGLMRRALDGVRDRL